MKHSFLLIASNTIITVKHILIECNDLAEIRKKYYEEIFFLNFLFPILQYTRSSKYNNDDNNSKDK